MIMLQTMRPIEAEPTRAVVLVLRDFPQQRAKQEEIKDYLAAYIKDWAEWWKRTQVLLKEAEYIDTSNSKLREYGLREAALSRVDETFDHFQRLRHRLPRPEFKITVQDVHQQAKVLNVVQDTADVPARIREVMFKYFRYIID